MKFINWTFLEAHRKISINQNFENFIVNTFLLQILWFVIKRFVLQKFWLTRLLELVWQWALIILHYLYKYESTHLPSHIIWWFFSLQVCFLLDIDNLQENSANWCHMDWQILHGQVVLAASPALSPSRCADTWAPDVQGRKNPKLSGKQLFEMAILDNFETVWKIGNYL